ncbi:hypothetical protein RQP46_008812 [Phenoliferia psychrophenolica]
MLLSLALLALPFLVVASPQIQKRESSSVLAHQEASSTTLAESSDLAVTTLAFAQAATATASTFPDSAATTSLARSDSNGGTTEPASYSILAASTASFAGPASVIATGSEASSLAGADGTVTISLPQPTGASTVLELSGDSMSILGKREVTSVLASPVAPASVIASSDDSGDSSTSYASAKSSLATATDYFTTVAATTGKATAVAQPTSGA